ncbi:terminase small subunit [Listeria monocytogenes]|uniref:Terminase small subunit n=3 Tax=Listeria monocytogenes TaxID=1639 RepID=A0A4B9HXR1_LISMN|nr:terminase small subunit [Listeria monocytogenes]NP_463462.1 terminase small subunit [Listeria phage A118]EAE3707013.1 terminase small subunit [Listeria monocytogenes serotype 1/2b]MCZ94597.1 terminase small subunit [Listeria monocytogenes serotype 3c]AEO07287.1 terminase small subunit [Listeria monocytogenes 10403S]AKI44620.1 Terminase small subunit [Listeria monocytogenes]EAA0118292.1 terminase small subunit [Listeria monocytogenes]
MKLTEKQKRFADEYIKCGNATEAARLAGYSLKTANRIATENLSKPVIKDYIANALEKLEADRVMDYTEAMQLLTEIARGEMTEKVVVTYGDNYDVIDKEPEISQRINALKEIVKRHAAGGRDKLQEELIQAQIDKLRADTKQESNQGITTIIMSNVDEMQAYLDKKAGGNDERDDTQTTN